MPSAQIALADVSSVIPVDEVVEAMGEIGASMETRYKETALGGLAEDSIAESFAGYTLILPLEFFDATEMGEDECIKFAVYRVSTVPRVSLSGTLDRIGCDAQS